MKRTDVHAALAKKDTVVVNLRAVPADLHRALRIAAMELDISMENHIINILTAAAGKK